MDIPARLLSARKFLNDVRQCYLEMKTNKEPSFSILSSLILCFSPILSYFLSMFFLNLFLGIPSSSSLRDANKYKEKAKERIRG